MCHDLPSRVAFIRAKVAHLGVAPAFRA